MVRGEEIQHVCGSWFLLQFYHSFLCSFTICLPSAMFQGVRQQQRNAILALEEPQSGWKRAVGACDCSPEWSVPAHWCVSILGLERSQGSTFGGVSFELNMKGWFSICVRWRERVFQVGGMTCAQACKTLAHGGNVCGLLWLKLWMPVRGGRWHGRETQQPGAVPQAIDGEPPSALPLKHHY